jgi:tmRNA-binding protein
MRLLPIQHVYSKKEQQTRKFLLRKKETNKLYPRNQKIPIKLYISLLWVIETPPPMSISMTT